MGKYFDNYVIGLEGTVNALVRNPEFLQYSFFNENCKGRLRKLQLPDRHMDV